MDHKKVYGAGFHAGMQAANAKVETMAMSGLRLKSLMDQQTGIAKKVYECVPLSEAFDAKRICTELARCGSAPDIHIVNGCLKALKESGLVTEVRGLFQRVKIRAENDVIKQVIPPKETEKSVEPVIKDPLDRLAAAASHLRSMGKVFEGIAIEIEDVALQLEDRSAEGNAEVKKLRQLADLLKTL